MHGPEAVLVHVPSHHCNRSSTSSMKFKEDGPFVPPEAASQKIDLIAPYSSSRSSGLSRSTASSSALLTSMCPL
jgi:hypothetical protein